MSANISLQTILLVEDDANDVILLALNENPNLVQAGNT